MRQAALAIALSAVHASWAGDVTIINVGDTAQEPPRPDYCYVVLGDAMPNATVEIRDRRAKLNKAGKLCHPPLSPYYSFLARGHVGTLGDCMDNGYDLPDVLLRVCTATSQESRDSAIGDVATETRAVKSFGQKTHVALALQVTRDQVSPTLMVHTKVGHVSAWRRAPEFHSWVWGLFVSGSPGIDVSYADRPKGDDDSATPNIGLGVLFSKRPSFGTRGFAVGVGGWRSKSDNGAQFVVSTNLMSLPWSAE